MTPPTGSSRPPLPAEIARLGREELAPLAQPGIPRVEGGTVVGIPAIPLGALELAGLGQQPGGIGQPEAPVVPPYFRSNPPAMPAAFGTAIAGTITPHADGRPFMIGRLPGSDLQIARDGVSRHHAFIYQHEGHWFLVDGERSPNGNIVPSLNGVFVNGRRVQQWTRLRNGDVIGIRHNSDPNSGVLLYTFREPGVQAGQAGENALACYAPPAADPALASSVAGRARVALLSAVSGRAMRFSPSPSAWATQRAVRVDLAFDLTTGEMVPANQTASRVNVLQVTVGADMDSQRIFLEGQARAGLEHLARREDLTPVMRSVVTGLLSLDNASLVSASPSARAALQPPQEEVQVLPIISPEHVARMRTAIAPAARAVQASTIMGIGPMSLNLNPPVAVGFVHLDGDGNVAGATLMRPEGMSPRGTLYSNGIRGGIAVPVVAISDGTILRTDIPAEANPTQTAALLALENNPENLARREAFLRHYPYGIDMAVGRGIGQLIQDLNASFSEFRDRTIRNEQRYQGQLALVSDGQGGYRFRPTHQLSAQEGTPLALIDVGLSVPRNYPLSQMAFTYRVAQGQPPAEVTTLLEYVRRRAELVWSDLMGQ